MKICFAHLKSHSMPVKGQRIPGAGAEVLRSLATEMHKLGHKVILLTPKINFPFPFDKIEFTNYLPCTNKVPFTIYLMIRKCKQIMKQCDIIQVHLPNPSFAFISDIISFKAKRPLVTNFESCLMGEEERDRLKKVLWSHPNFYVSRYISNSPLFLRLSRFSFSFYTVSTHYQKEQLLALGVDGEKIRVIPNFVDFSRFLSLRNDDRTKNSSFGKRPIITYIGHFTPVKGVYFLIEAFSEIKKKYPDALLILAHSGHGDKYNISGLIKKYRLQKDIMLLGVVDVVQLLLASDVLVLPYLFSFGTQCLPNLILEAFATGVPLVTTRVRPNIEIVIDGETGVVVPPGNSKQIAEGVMRLLGDTALRKRIVDKQREVAKEKFDLQNIVAKYLELYERMLYEQT